MDAIRKYGIVREPLTDNITITQLNEIYRQAWITTDKNSDNTEYNLKFNGKITIKGGTTAQVLATSIQCRVIAKQLRSQ
jgi:hypothetical protein